MRWHTNCTVIKSFAWLCSGIVCKKSRRLLKGRNELIINLSVNEWMKVCMNEWMVNEWCLIGDVGMIKSNDSPNSLPNIKLIEYISFNIALNLWYYIFFIDIFVWCSIKNGKSINKFPIEMERVLNFFVNLINFYRYRATRYPQWRWRVNQFHFNSNVKWKFELVKEVSIPNLAFCHQPPSPSVALLDFIETALSENLKLQIIYLLKNDSNRYALCGRASINKSMGSSATTERKTDGPRRPTTVAASRYWRPSESSINRRSTWRGLVKPSRPSRDGPRILSRLSFIVLCVFCYSNYLQFELLSFFT